MNARRKTAQWLTCVFSAVLLFCITGQSCVPVPGDNTGGSTDGSGGGSSGGGSSGGGSSGGGSSGGGSSGGGSAPAAPVFPDPANGEPNVALQPDALGGRSIVDFSWWAPATATRYVVEISRNSSFSGSSTETWGASSNSLRFVITSTQYRYGTTYYWRVTAHNSYGSTTSVTWSFTTEAAPLQPPDAPAGPSPANGATGISINTTLDWSDAARAGSYDVYFGTANPPPFAGVTSDSSWNPGTLWTGAAYYWKVVAHNNAGQSAGPVWSFATTPAEPSEPSAPNPAAGASDVSIESDLDWADSARATSYEVCFGTANPPPSVGQTTSSSLALSRLQYNTTYYWKIVARGEQGRAKSGPVWSFKTETDGTDGWTALGSGFDWSVDSLATYNGDLIAGGRFRKAGNITTNRVARWDGTTWRPLGDGITSNYSEVHRLIEFNGILVAGGSFSTAGSSQANNIAFWNGSTWSPMGSGSNGGVDSFVVYRGELIAASYFADLDGSGSTSVARWDGAAWRTLGGVDNGAFALTVYNGELVAAGNIWSAGGVSCEGIALWNGSSWRPLFGSPNNFITNLIVYNGELIATGDFTRMSGNETAHIARTNGVNDWRPLGRGLNGVVHALAVYNGELIAGGEFTTAGDVAARYVARWTGQDWQPLGDGVDGVVFALTVHDGKLIAGGYFTTAGGVSAAHIASWSPPQNNGG